MNTKQMEFGLDGNRSQCRTVRRRTSPGARWWFDQMHSVVDRAFDWSRTVQARPEQIHISFVARARHGKV